MRGYRLAASTVQVVWARKFRVAKALPIVTLSSHASMGETQDGTKAVAAEVALPAAPLPACRCCLL